MYCVAFAFYYTPGMGDRGGGNTLNEPPGFSALVSPKRLKCKFSKHTLIANLYHEGRGIVPSSVAHLRSLANQLSDLQEKKL